MKRPDFCTGIESDPTGVTDTASAIDRTVVRGRRIGGDDVAGFSDPSDGSNGFCSLFSLLQSSCSRSQSDRQAKATVT